MKVLQEYQKSTLKIIKPDSSAQPPYKMYTYCEECKVKEHLLLFNFVTAEVLLLENSDFTTDSTPATLDILSLEPACRDYLLSHRFIVNENNEDWHDVDAVRTILKLRDQIDFEGFQNFTVLTTTDCNARCYYCFEKGTRKITMDEKTAMDTADFILKNCSKTGKKNVHLSWFGGEPLYNDRAIDIISRKLTDAGIGISSSMITNGLLLDAKECKKAVTLWKLTNVQVTLDGTEKIYNKTKAYIGGIANAYAAVLSNIQSAMDAGIRVNIRLNVSKGNIDDLFLLADELAERFQKKKPSVYGFILFQYNSEEHARDRTELEKQFEELKEKLRMLGLTDAKTLSKKEFLNENERTEKGGVRLYHCMADNPYSVVIMPDGRLDACEHFADDRIWGSIYSDGDKFTARFPLPSGGKEVSTIDYWSECELYEECHNCHLYPFCVRILHCPDQAEYCEPELKERLLFRVEEAKKRFIREAEQL